MAAGGKLQGRGTARGNRPKSGGGVWDGLMMSVNRFSGHRPTATLSAARPSPYRIRPKLAASAIARSSFPTHM